MLNYCITTQSTVIKSTTVLELQGGDYFHYNNSVSEWQTLHGQYLTWGIILVMSYRTGVRGNISWG